MPEWRPPGPQSAPAPAPAALPPTATRPPTCPRPGALALAPARLPARPQVPASSFSFLTRLHYCAADTATHGPAAEWGEHEVDYVLFVRPQQPVSLQPNPDEVGGRGGRGGRSEGGGGGKGREGGAAWAGVGTIPSLRRG